MASSPKPPPVTPATDIINAQAKANQFNRSGPGGTQTYGVGPDGKPTFNTTLSPALQGLFDRGVSLAGTDLKPLQNPKGFDGLQSALMQKVAGNVAQPHAQMPQKPQGQGLPQIGSISGQQVNPVWDSALNQIWGKH